MMRSIQQVIIRFPLFFFTFFIVQNSSGQEFLNGDIENNSGFCYLNVPNNQLNTTLPGVNGYGIGNEIDLMDNLCGYGTANTGNYFLCLANSTGTNPDGCTFELCLPLIQGNSYTLTYYDRGWNVSGCCPPGVPLEIGVSSDPNSQGTIIYNSPTPALNAWSQRVITFIAPIGGLYISFQAENNNTRWTQIDNLSMNTACCYAPVLNDSMTNETCQQSNGSITVYASGAIAPYHYSWDTPGADTTQTINGLAAGTYVVTVADSGGCTTVFPITVINDSLLNLIVNTEAAVLCLGDSVILTAGGAATYLWNPVAGLTTVNDSVVIASPSITTTYTLTGTLSACMDSLMVTVAVQPLPLSSFTLLPAAVCAGADVTITYTGASLPIATYNWNFNGGIITSGSGQGPYVVHWNNGATYIISLAVTENGCTSLLTQLPVIIYTSPDPSFNIAPPEICARKMVQVYYTGNASASANYNWNFASGTILTGTGQGPYILQYNLPGLNVVMLTVTQNGCPSSENDTLQIDPLPVASFVPSDTTGCDSLFVQFTNLSAGATSYQWDFGDGFFDTVSNPGRTYGIGSYTVSLIVSNAYGCKDTLTIPDYIHVYSTPTAQFSVNPPANIPVFMKEANFQFSNSSLNSSDFRWEFGDGTSSTATDPSHQYLSAGNYTATLFAYDGSCFDSASVSFLMVDQNPGYFFPGGFTPNGDGLNDVFSVLGSQIQSIHMSVFNRWGKTIFQSSDISNGWDGTYNGNPAEMGTYVYVAEIVYLTAEKATAKGSITLIR